jgi:hypothetical protein
LSIGAAGVSLPEGLKPLAVAAQAGDSDEYESGHLYLVRPDAYVMMSSKEGDSAPILEALGRIAAGAEHQTMGPRRAL